MKSLPAHTSQFAEYFKDHGDAYVIIGGTATLLHIEQRSGSAPRVTKDLDIVVLDLSEEVGTSEFLERFKAYITDNGYTCKSLSGGKPQAFRFTNPTSGLAPRLIEIISRKFEWTPEDQGAQRIEAHEMSAIALPPEFYEFTKVHRVTEQIGELGDTSVSVASVAALILLKALAFQNLSASGRPADRSNAPKHLLDIARLATVLTDTDKVTVNALVFAPLKAVLEQGEKHFPANVLLSCGWAKTTKSAVVVQAITDKISVV